MKEGMLSRGFWVIACTALILAAEIGSAATEGRIDEAPLVIVEEDRLTLSAEDRPLGEVLEEIQRQSGVEILGMDGRVDEPVTFFSKPDAMEKVLKRLLRHLDETNFAFEYSRTRLRRISVLPSGGSEATVRSPEPTAAAAQSPDEPEKVNTVRVLKVNEGTQAADLDLSQGDLILEYDGAKINSAQELVAAVKRKSPQETVEMVVVRDRQPFRLVLNGGLIGVNILTVSVPQADLGL